MKRMTTKLGAILAGCLMTVSAWGQETIFHYVYSGASTAPAVGETLTATGGTILVERSENSTKTLSTESFTYDSSVPADMKITGGTKAIKFGTSDVWFKLELTDGVFKSGDIISVCGYKSYILSTTNTHGADVATIATGDDKSSYKVGTAAIPEGVSTSVLYLKRAESTSSGFSSIKVERPVSTPYIESFVVAGIEAVIDQDAKTITAELPYGTDLTSLTPEIVTGGSGSVTVTPNGAQNFTSPVNYTVSNGNSSEDVTYTVTLTVEASLSNDATLKSLTAGEQKVALVEGTYEYSVEFPYATAEVPQIAAEVNYPAATVVITQATTLPGTATAVVTAQDGTTIQTYTVNLTRKAPGLYQALFDNGFDAFINGTQVDVYYFAGEEQPQPTTLVATVEGATATFTEGKIVVGGEYGNAEYTITYHEVTPFAPTTTESVTFCGTETYVASSYGWDNTKKWRFAKSVEEETNPRISSGKNRLYFFFGPAEKVTFTSSVQERDIKVYVNGVEYPSVTNTGAAGATFDVTLNEDKNNLVGIVSNQTGGDGGVGAITLVGKEYTGSTGLIENAVLSVYFADNTLFNPENVMLYVYNAAGQMVMSGNADLDMTAQPAGLYIVRSAEGAFKIVK